MVTNSGYPRNWPTISRAIRKRAGYKCEACGVENGQPNPITGTLVALHVAHLDQQRENCDPANLRVFCQKCHKAYDVAMQCDAEKKETYRARGVAAPISRRNGQPLEWLSKLQRNDASREQWLSRDALLYWAQFVMVGRMNKKQFVRAYRSIIDQRMETVRFVFDAIRVKRKDFRGTRLRILWLTPPESPDVWHTEVPTGDGGYAYAQEMERAFEICDRVNELQPVATAQHLTIPMMRQFVASVAAEFPSDYPPKPADWGLLTNRALQLESGIAFRIKAVILGE